MLKATNEFLSEIDVLADKRREEIRSAQSCYPTDKTVYYFSNNGNDDADGLSPETAKKTLSALNALKVNEGDTILLERGSFFRGKIRTPGAGITLSAYGKGAKPIVSGSPENCARPECWSLMEGTDNIWVYHTLLTDIGGIVFDYGKTAGIKEIPFYKDGKYICNATKEEFDEAKHLMQDLSFFSRMEKKAGEERYILDIPGTLSLRCDKGNPGEIFESIELFTRGNNIAVAYDNTTIDNLCIMHCGCHGIGTGNRNGLTVRNCELGWIGGCVQFYDSNSGYPTRFGNGIEIYVGCKDFTVENCYIYQVYDAGVTHQYKGMTENNSARPVTMENVLYKDNLIEHCIYSIEYFLEQDNNEDQIMKNILMTGNICRFAGYGWGSYPSRAAHIKGWDHRNISENFVIENNIFDRSRSMVLHCGVQEENHLPTMRNNTYIQIDNPKYNLGRYNERGGNTFCYRPERIPYAEAEAFNAEHMHDEGAKFYLAAEEPEFYGIWPSGEKG